MRPHGEQQVLSELPDARVFAARSVGPEEAGELAERLVLGLDIGLVEGRGVAGL
jgi:hypothetical protein